MNRDPRIKTRVSLFTGRKIQIFQKREKLQKEFRDDRRLSLTAPRLSRTISARGLGVLAAMGRKAS